MFSLKDKDSETWSINMFNESNLSVNKTFIPFSVVGVDPAIEKKNGVIKVLGSTKGVANNWKTQDEYFFAVEYIGNVIEKFCEVFKYKTKLQKEPNTTS